MLTNKSYDVLKKFVQVILPAVSALYFGLAAIWNLPAAEQVVGTIAVITTFLGVTLGISTKAYENSERAYDGSMTVHTPVDGPKTFTLEINDEPETLQEKDAIRFKVQSTVEPLESDLL